MLIIERLQTDPYFNIAAEEYLLKNISEDCFMLWQNEPSVIIGKHQNTLAEINPALISQLNIPVIRRISGGGTVYHDLGNLNFSFIKQGQPEKLIDFSQFLQPIIAALNEMGLPAKQERKNDIRINGLKVSGNSEHVHRNRVLHHGTLLFNSNLSRLNEIIQNSVHKFSDKSVKSVRSKVGNIVAFMKNPISLADFRRRIASHVCMLYPESKQYALTNEDITGINDLANKKYRTWDWNYGYSPVYNYENRISRNGIEYSIWIKVKDGIIEDHEISTVDKGPLIRADITKILEGSRHSYEEIKAQILLLKQKGETLTFDPNILLDLLFR